jgi:two-component system, OmpR family, sensor histidine kinase KdpD
MAQRSSRRDYALSVAAVVLCTGISAVMVRYFELTNLVMVYLLGTLLVSLRGRRGPAALSAVLSVLCFDFFFVPPRFTFNVSDAQYFLTFIVMFVTAMVISHLTIRMREEAEAARQGEERTVWLMEKAKKAELDAESERLRSSLLSSVSHDFRTPLAAILGSAGTLLKKEELRNSPSMSELVQNIQTEGERLSHLVQNLLEATRLEAGIQIRKEGYTLEEVVGGALERLQTVLDQRVIKVNLPEDLPVIPMDAVLMEQVFINLLENAARHTPLESPIEISASVENAAVKIGVADRGPGLKKEDMERVFDKFYRGSASKGSGLGLAICRAIVLAHEGRIWAENKPEGGAVFQFTLPLDIHHEH